MIDEETRKRQRAACKRWREKFPEKAKASQQSWRERNKEKLKADLAAWEEANKERREISKRAWREANKEQRAKRTKGWIAANREKNAATRKRWREKNAHKKRIYRLARRARKNSADGRATNIQIAARIELYGRMCGWCGKAPYQHIDHIIPLAKGGTNWPANLRPSCARCNQTKHARNWTKRKPVL